MELRSQEEMRIFQVGLREKYNIVLKLIEYTEDESSVLRGILFYYDNYDKDKNLEVETIMKDLQKCNLQQKRSFLKELSKEIYNKDCIFHLKYGKDVSWEMKNGIEELEKELY